jgi:hypothetical protein
MKINKEYRRILENRSLLNAFPNSSVGIVDPIYKKARRIFKKEEDNRRDKRHYKFAKGVATLILLAFIGKGGYDYYKFRREPEIKAIQIEYKYNKKNLERELKYLIQNHIDELDSLRKVYENKSNNLEKELK